MQKRNKQYKLQKQIPTSRFNTLVSVKNLASGAKGSAEVSAVAAEAASLWADVSGARGSPETSPLVSSAGTSGSTTLSETVLLPICGA